MVEIPKTLIEKIPGRHFIRVAKKGKEPIDQGWTTNPMSADDPKLEDWLKEGGNYGVIGGYGLVIVDMDLNELKFLVMENLPPTFTVESPGSKGWHLYYLCSLEKPIRLRDKEGENIGDIQGQGKQVVGPGSTHPNGEMYKVVNDIVLAQVTRQQLVEVFKEFVVPDREIERIEASARWEKSEGIEINVLQVVPLGGLTKRGDEYQGPHPLHGSTTGRNFSVNPAKNVWHCYRHGTGGSGLAWIAVEEGIISCEDSVSGSLRGEQFHKAKKVAIKRGLIKEPKIIGERKKKRSQADRLIEVCLSQELILFHDQHKTPYARVKQNDVNRIIPIRSRSFRAWLSSLLWQSEQKAPGTEALYSAIHVLEAMAIFDGRMYTLYNRVAPAEDGIWVEMTDDKWRAIKVTAEGWHIVQDPPILFKRYTHQQPLVEPKTGGDPWKFLEFVNIANEDQKTRLTLLCAVISFLIPLIPHVILVVYGIQGSGKTMLFVLIRRIIDPSSVEVLAMPRNETERVQQLDHNWCAFYDNVTNLPYWISDTLCRAATGGGFTKRGLYTDDDDVIYNYKRCLGVSGINIAAQRGDLLDRSLLVGLKDIPEDKRRDEQKFLAEFESCKAEILGSFLDTLSKAIKIYPTINPKRLFRMADYTMWGIAIAIALGKDEEEFMEAYGSKVKGQVEEAAHSSPVATVLMDYMETVTKKWEGTPSQLYVALKNHAKDLGIPTRQKAWPRAPNVLVRRLNELTPSLKALGLNIETGIRTGQKGTRKVRINTVSTVSTVSNDEETDDTDDVSPTPFTRVLSVRNKVLESVKQAESEKEAARRAEVLETLEKQGFGREEITGIISLLIREGVFFEPREGWLKTTFNGSIERKSVETAHEIDWETLASEEQETRITVTCGSCEFFHTKKCPKESPLFIQRTATYAANCKHYWGKSE